MVRRAKNRERRTTNEERRTENVERRDEDHWRAELPASNRRRAVDIVAAVRDAVGPDVQILIEMHGRFYKVLEHFNDFADPWVRDLVDYAPYVDPVDGCFGVPERPGLGVRLNHDVCARHPRTGGRIRLFEEGWERRGS